MARKALIDSRERPYHVTARTNNREPFPGRLETAWRILTDELYLHTKANGILIHAFVLMPNHFHLLVTTPEIALPKIMKEVLGSSTRILNTGLHRSGHVFGGPYHWSIIYDPNYYAHAFKYVCRNPVRAQICERVSEYPFSTASCVLGEGRLPVPIVEPLGNLGVLLPASSFASLEAWLDEPTRADEEEAIRKGLRKRTFELDVDRVTRKHVHLRAPLDAPSLPEST